MNELIDLIVQKTGISAEQARTAAETVVGFLKDKLPGPLGTHVESALTEDSAASNALGNVAKGIGNLLGK